MKRLTNGDRLKRLYVIGRLTLDEFMERIDAELDAGTLDDAPPSVSSPQAAAEKWRASASASAGKWAENVEREAARIASRRPSPPAT